MRQYLLAAEADKIQDFIFRSARLREVVGGSQLLSRFCQEVPNLLALSSGAKKEDIIISDGGSFRIIFNSKEQALTFGAHLAEVYRLAAGGTLTLAEPFEVKEPIETHFAEASKQAEDDLRKAKRWRKDWLVQEQIPYMAFCASCGIGLAIAHQAYYDGEDAQYLCRSCLNKCVERPPGELGSFLQDFYQAVVSDASLDQVDWPGKKKRDGRTEVDPLEDIADYDPRHNVAYMLADGNDMGKLFSKCRTPKIMHALSRDLTKAIHNALAKPTRLSMAKQHGLLNRPNFIPVLPLILGGDDLFVLIPAPWALSFADCFCRAYEDEVKDLLEQVGIDGPQPTVSAGVVICKSKHPYTQAHETGKRLLKEAKKASKLLALNNNQFCSAVNFDVVLGGRLVTYTPQGEIRSTMRTYWASQQDIPNRWGLQISQLIDQRCKLRYIPQKRLSELLRLYNPTELPESLLSKDRIPWQNRLERLLERINRIEEHGNIVRMALASLGGDKESAYWRKVDRYEDSWHGQGLPDLLEVWDFSLDLRNDPKMYEG